MRHILKKRIMLFSDVVFGAYIPVPVIEIRDSLKKNLAYLEILYIF